MDFAAVGIWDDVQWQVLISVVVLGRLQRFISGRVVVKNRVQQVRLRLHATVAFPAVHSDWMHRILEMCGIHWTE